MRERLMKSVLFCMPVEKKLISLKLNIVFSVICQQHVTTDDVTSDEEEEEEMTEVVLLHMLEIQTFFVLLFVHTTSALHDL